MELLRGILIIVLIVCLSGCIIKCVELTVVGAGAGQVTHLAVAVKVMCGELEAGDNIGMRVALRDNIGVSRDSLINLTPDCLLRRDIIVLSRRHTDRAVARSVGINIGRIALHINQELRCLAVAADVVGNACDGGIIEEESLIAGLVILRGEDISLLISAGD